MKNILICLTLFLLLPTSPLLSQQPTDSTLVIVETKDGNEYVGTIISQTPAEIRLNTKTIGVITLSKSQIVSMKPVKPEEMKDGEYWFHNPYATTRYFYNPSGYGLPAGQGYYQNTWILMNQVSVGITDNISIGAGMIPVFLFTLGSGEASTPFWVTPKVSIPVKKDKLNLGVGALYATILGEGGEGIGIAYGVATFGSKDKNLTTGLGWGYSTDGGLSNRPTLSISYIRRGKPKWAFLTENYFISAGEEAVVILSGGARYIGKKISIDFGALTLLAITESQGFFPVIPWLSIAVPFDVGKKTGS